MELEQPEWLKTLQAECDRARSQSKVAQKLRHGQKHGFPSAATLSQVLKGNYKGDLERIRGMVEGVFMAKTVTCPIAGELARDTCIQFQTRPFAATNPLRVQLNKDGICITCPNRRKS